MLRCQFKVLIPKQQRGQPYSKVSCIGIRSQPLSQESRFLGWAGGIQVCGAGALRQDVRAATTMPTNISHYSLVTGPPPGQGEAKPSTRPPRTSHPTLAHPLALPTSSSSARAASLGPIRLLLLQSSSPHRDTLPLQFWLPRGSGYEWEAAGPKAELPGLAQSTGHRGLLLTPAQPRHSRPLPVSLGLPAKHCTMQATGLPQPNVPPPAPFCRHYLL